MDDNDPAAPQGDDDDDPISALSNNEQKEQAEQHHQKEPNEQAEQQSAKAGKTKRTAQSKSRAKKPKEPEKNIPGVLNMLDLANLPDIEWAVQMLLMRQGLSILHGAPGTLKTFLALHIAGCCAYGLPFLPNARRCRRGLVLYVAFEGLPAFKHRRRAWLRLHGLPEPHHDALKLINPRREKLDGIDGIDFDFSSEARVRNLINTGKHLSEMEKLPVVLVVVDVLKEALPNQVESVKTFAAAAQYARLIADELRCHVMILHHNTSNTDNMRGPKSLEGAVETRVSQKLDGMHIFARWAKNREGASQFTLVLRAHKITLGTDKDGEEISSLAVETLGIDQTGSTDADDTGSKLRQIAAEMGDEELLMGPLLKRLKWSEDGRGGRQRQWVRDAIGDGAPDKPRLVHLSANLYKRVWIRRDGKQEWVNCQKLTADEIKAEEEARRIRLEQLAEKLKGGKRKDKTEQQPQEQAA